MTNESEDSALEGRAAAWAAEARRGDAALARAAWLEALLAAGAAAELALPIAAEHFVAGALAPFRFRFAQRRPGGAQGRAAAGAAAPREPVCVLAVYCGAHATNTAGQVQGGGVAAVMDLAVAVSGLLSGRGAGFGTTKSLSVRYLAPTPLGQVLRCEVEAAFDRSTGLGDARARLTDGEQRTVYAEADAVLVDVKLRKRWRDAQPRL